MASVGDDKHSPTINNLFRDAVNFSDLLDEIAIGVAVLGLDRKVVALNQTLKGLTGFTQNEACGVPCRHILRSSVCMQNCPALHINGKSGPKCIEGDLINRDRQLIPIRLTFAPLKTLSGKLAGFLETVEDIRSLKKGPSGGLEGYSFDHIVGKSPQMDKIFQILPSLAQSESSVLITGETGTGKDMLAETIHHMSDRAKGPFVKINCGALPETLLESELFGHSKGAFTGAIENKIGRFQHAHNGTLYLTEIGDLPLSLQIKLLTFLDDKVVVPLGSTKETVADVRIIAATHRNLEQMVVENRFRKDLMFRLNVIRLHLPPLRKRQGDVRLLLDHFLHKVSAQLSRKTPEITRHALNILLGYSYPGNVRELRNFVEYAVNICNGDKISPRHLPAYLTEPGQPVPEAHFSEDNAGTAAGPGAGGFPRPEPDQRWPDVEKQMIVEALIRSGGRKNRAAEALGWSRSTLWRKMKQLKIG